MSFPLEEYAQLSATGHPIGRAVVTQIWGSGPRAIGATMIATDAGAIAGSVSGGCVESAVALEIAEALRSGQARTVTYGVSDETAWGVGLACGGTLRVYIEPSIRPELLAAARDTGGTVIATVLDDPEAPGAALRFVAGTNDHQRFGPPSALLDMVIGEVEQIGRRALVRGTSESASLALPDGRTLTVLFESFPQQPTLYIVGGVHVAQSLIALARPLGYRTVVADGRSGWLTRERFPDADQLLCLWPDEAFAQVPIDGATCVCVLSHDPRFDDPALRIALRSPAAYIGAIGSRSTQAARRERLRAEGFSDDELARLHGPIGLDLGGREPMDTALAIVAEIAAVRHGTGGGFLRASPATEPASAR